MPYYRQYRTPRHSQLARQSQLADFALTAIEFALAISFGVLCGMQITNVRW
jgi:hypothetical protein